MERLRWQTEPGKRTMAAAATRQLVPSTTVGRQRVGKTTLLDFMEGMPPSHWQSPRGKLRRLGVCSHGSPRSQPDELGPRARTKGLCRTNGKRFGRL
jgi:hypothetical protein